MPLVHERINTLSEAVPMLGFLFVDEESFSCSEELDEDGRAVVQASYDALAGLDDWATEPIESALRTTLVDERGLKPRQAFGPVRVAVTGSHVSPPLFESLELLGRDRSLGRLQAALG
jgi:glutamyl-tRNA synthetase